MVSSLPDSHKNVFEFFDLSLRSEGQCSLVLRQAIRQSNFKTNFSSDQCKEGFGV